MLNRNEFLKTVCAMTALSFMPVLDSLAKGNSMAVRQAPQKIIPERIRKGDTIGLISPAGVITREQLEETILKIEELGFHAYHLPSVLSQYGYFAGTDKERVEELMHMFTNPDVKAIWCVRGGYGGIRMLDIIDYSLIRENPKPLIGYSDVTGLLVSIYQQTGLVGFHGPVGISTFNNFSVTSIEKVLMHPTDRYKCPYQREEETEGNTEYEMYTITNGKAEGELLGGNLSVLTSMAGSKYEPDFKDKIVFLEEVDEKTYRIDRMLIQLLQATNLREAAGIVMGVFHHCDQNDEPRFTLKEVLQQIIRPLGIPASYGLSFGHIANKFTIPVGIYAKFNAGKNTLTLLEKAVT